MFNIFTHPRRIHQPVEFTTCKINQLIPVAALVRAGEIGPGERIICNPVEGYEAGVSRALQGEAERVDAMC